MITPKSNLGPDSIELPQIIERTEEIDEIDETEELVVKASGFAKYAFSVEVLNAIKQMNYLSPTPVQEACIPYLLENNTDLLALAKTGTGKTAAFGLPLAEKLSTDKKLQALVLCPTRELAAQVAQNLQLYGKVKGLKVVTILGGESYRKQIDALKLGPQILVSTPGRLVDLMEQGIVKLSSVQYFVLDEADEMLSFGFQEALETMWKQLSENKNEFKTWLFSATMSESIKRLTKKYLKSPHEIMLNTSTEKIRVDAYAAVVFEEDKEDTLSLLIQSEPEFYGIIFAQTKQQVAKLEIRFRSMGFQVDSLHGDKVQADRVRTINRMKKREVKILVATDVAARGLDIEDLTHVVNFELPWDVETYTHRIGRTARAGKQGTVWTLVRPKECQFLRKFERALKFEFKPLVIPTVEDVRSMQIRRWLGDVAKATVLEKDRQVFAASFKKLDDEKLCDLFPETQEWLMKAMILMKIGSGANLRQPRSFDLKKSDEKRFDNRGAYSQRPSQRQGYRDDRGPRGRNDDRPARSRDDQRGTRSRDDQRGTRPEHAAGYASAPTEKRGESRKPNRGDNYFTRDERRSRNRN